MIFSDKIYKVGSSKNATLSSINENKLNIFLFNKNIQKITLSTEKFTTSTLENINANYDFIYQVDTNLFVVGYDKNISVINEL